MTRVLFLVLCCCLALSARAETEEQDVEEPSEETTVKVQETPVEEPFVPPTRPPGDVYFFESFSDSNAFENNWVRSKATKSEDNTAKYNGEWKLDSPYHVGATKDDIGLVMPEANQLYAISSKLERTYDFADNDKDEFAVQFEVNFQEALNCGGAYVKLLSADDDLDLAKFQDKTPYSIMFGPDKCGQSSKIHFIIRFKNPVSGEIEEKHAHQPTGELEFFNDRRTHLFSLYIRNDDYFSVSVDLKPLVTGSLKSDLTPSVVPLEEIDDPEDKKPSDWDDKEKIPEPDAVKPDDWDEDAPKMIDNPDAVKPEGWLDDGPGEIPDPDASKPEDWDEEEDGEWEPPSVANPVCEEVGCGEWTPPKIKNPLYKGKWSAPLIDNPNYMGIWKPRKIHNPAYFELDSSVFSKLTPISALGFELWTVGKGIHFDNIVITGEMPSASSLTRKTWILKNEKESRTLRKESAFTSWLDYFIDIANEHPYLWALYAVGLVMPFVLCAACCIRSKPSSSRDDVGRRKKTDEPTEDDAQPKVKSKQKEESFIAQAEDEEPEKKEEEKQEEEKVEEEVEDEEKKKPQLRQRKVKKKAATEGEGETKGEEEEEEGGEGEGEGQDPEQDPEPPADDGEGFQVRKSPRRGGGGSKKRIQRED